MTLHRYLYCANNPINRIDPGGQEFTIGGLLTVISGSLILAQISNPAVAAVEAKASVAIERKLAKQYALSPQGLQIIASFEGFSATVYKDLAGKDTIGFGHLLVKGEEQRFAKGITRDQAYNLLRSDARKAENAVREAVTAPLQQNEYDALVSFTYNLGNVLPGSTLLRKLNALDYEGAGAQFLVWNRAAGKVSAGLTDRRRKERIWFDMRSWLYNSELGVDWY